MCTISNISVIVHSNCQYYIIKCSLMTLINLGANVFHPLFSWLMCGVSWGQARTITDIMVNKELPNSHSIHQRHENNNNYHNYPNWCAWPITVLSNLNETCCTWCLCHIIYVIEIMCRKFHLDYLKLSKKFETQHCTNRPTAPMTVCMLQYI